MNINSIAELIEVRKCVGHYCFFKLLNKLNSLPPLLGVAFYPYEDFSYYR